MLNKLRVNFKLAKSLSNNEKIKILFLISIISNILCSFNILKGISYEETIFYYISTQLYIDLLFVILFISSAFAISIFNKSFNTIIRCKDKKEYLSNLIIFIFIVNLIVYITHSIIGIIIITLKSAGNINLEMLTSYNIPFIIYNIYTYIKYFIVIELLISISVCFYKLFGKSSLAALILFALVILKDNFIYSNSIITSIDLKHLFYGYFLGNYQYSNFILDIFYLIIEILILTLIYEAINSLICNYKKINISER